MGLLDFEHPWAFARPLACRAVSMDDRLFRIFAKPDDEWTAEDREYIDAKERAAGEGERL